MTGQPTQAIAQTVAQPVSNVVPFITLFLYFAFVLKN